MHNTHTILYTHTFYSLLLLYIVDHGVANNYEVDVDYVWNMLMIMMFMKSECTVKMVTFRQYVPRTGFLLCLVRSWLRYECIKRSLCRKKAKCLPQHIHLPFKWHPYHIVVVKYITITITTKITIIMRWPTKIMLLLSYVKCNLTLRLFAQLWNVIDVNVDNN